jgi:hypothetical protein
MKRKIISITIALLLCMSMAAPVFAEKDSEGFETVTSITVNITDVPGLTATLTYVHDRYVSSVKGYNVTFSFANFYDEDTYEGGNLGAVSFNKAVVVWAPDESLHYGDSTYKPITLKAGESIPLENESYNGFLIFTDGSKVVAEWPSDWDEDYVFRGALFDTIPMELGSSDESLASGGFTIKSIYDISTASGQSPAPSAPSLTAKPTASTVLVNGKNVAFDAYNISDNNYFKLRDLASVLNGSKKQFAVGYDNATKAITLTSGKAYEAVGGEMVGKGAGNKTPAATTSKITLDGNEVKFTAYNIDGNNYFKLRDIGEAFDFDVTWDGAKNTIVIDTSTGYTPD